MRADRWIYTILFCGVYVLSAQAFRSPAGSRPAHRHATASLLPGGRILFPAGDQQITGPGPLGLAISPNGRTVITANSGPGRNSLSILERDHSGRWQVNHWPVPRDNENLSDASLEGWHSVSTGIAFANDHSAWVSEGKSGRISLMDWSGQRRRAVSIDAGEFTGSDAGDLVCDPARNIVYVVDRANSRVVAVDGRARQPLGSVRLSHPFALSLSPDRRTLYVTTETADANAVAVVNMTVPSSPAVEASIRTGPLSHGLRGILAAGDAVFASDGENDTITVIDSRTKSVTGEIPIRITGLENLRGIRPAGLAYHERTGWLLAAESGINAVAVIDPWEKRVLGHIPVGWLPMRVVLSGDAVFAACARGWGQGPSSPDGQLPHGLVSTFPIPAAGDLPEFTKVVMESNGLLPGPPSGRAPPAAIRYVVLILKGNRVFDEVFGDLQGAMGAPSLARYGMHGYADGERKRVSIRDIGVTPNHHTMAHQWAMADNFYNESEDYPGPWQPLDITRMLQHIEAHGVGIRSFDTAFDERVSDQSRVTRFIGEIDERYAKGGAELPRLMVLHLPNDRTGAARPDDGYPYRESFVADNDRALGRVLEYLSASRWWKDMAVFVTEGDAPDGADHIDAHRTVLIAAGPYIRRGYVTHVNASLPGLMKTVFALLGVPAMGLADATASGLDDLFAREPDLSGYKAVATDTRLFK